MREAACASLGARLGERMEDGVVGEAQVAAKDINQDVGGGRIGAGV